MLQVCATCQQPAVTFSICGEERPKQPSALNYFELSEPQGVRRVPVSAPHEGVACNVSKLDVFKLPFRMHAWLCVLVESVELISPNDSQCHYLHSASDSSWWWLPCGTFGKLKLSSSVSPGLTLMFTATNTQLYVFFFYFMCVKSCDQTWEEGSFEARVERQPFSICLEASSVPIYGRCSHVCMSLQISQTLWVPKVILHTVPTVHNTYINNSSIAGLLISPPFWNQLELI